MFFLDAKYSWEIFKFYFFQKLVIYVSIIVRKQQLIFKKNTTQKSANPSWESNINICFLKGGCKLKKIKKMFSRKYGTLEKKLYFFDWSTFAQERGGEGKIDKHLFWSILVGKHYEESVFSPEFWTQFFVGGEIRFFAKVLCNTLEDFKTCPQNTVCLEGLSVFNHLTLKGGVS